MKKESSSEAAAAANLTVLSVTPDPHDHLALGSIIGHSRWTLLKTKTLSAARKALLQHHDISVVICERDLEDGTWADILTCIQSLPHPPTLIVTSRLADDELWSLVLHLGGWDVLAKPFDRSEVLRSVRYAWEHWCRQIELRAAMRQSFAAAS
jgi:DNA-binding response OmpR family regulator